MKRKWLTIALTLCLAAAAGVVPVPSAEGSAPTRLEVMLEKTLWLTPSESVSAGQGKSFAVIYWEEPANSKNRSQYSVYLLNVTETSSTRTSLGRGVRVTEANAKEYEKNYIGYYRFPDSHTSVHAQLDNYVNYIFEVGSAAPYQEARIYPPLPNAHTNYQKNSDTCGGCHRTHYASHPKLLSRKIMQEMCLECHDGTKSSYDVLRGRARVPSGWAASPAGPFGTRDNPSTSFHNVFLEDEFDKPASEQFLLYAPGSGGERFNLTCTNCHSAHVTSNSSRYRFLKFAGETPVQAYTFVSGNQYKVLYKEGMNQFCGQCHSDYDYGSADNPRNYPEHVLRADNGNGVNKAGEYYRHPTGIDITGWPGAKNLKLPVERRDTKQYMTCGTCHVAHGTAINNSQQFSPELGDPALNLNAEDRYKYDYAGNRVVDAVNGQTYSSMLKRRQGMGICLECHMDQIWANTPGWVANPSR
jgi:predicted CXXCH cytochrome family protein